MSTYLELLQNAPPIGRKECGLGRILESEGREKHDEVLDAIFQVDEKGRFFPYSRLVSVFYDEYGWSEFFFRRHRHGKCVSCLNRIQTS
jgi:hypothetical protein